MRRETQSFYADCFYIYPIPREAPHLQTTGLASAGPESQPSRSVTGTQLFAFSQIPKILSPRGCMSPFTPPVLITHLGFYFDICDWRTLPASKKTLKWVIILLLLRRRLLLIMIMIIRLTVMIIVVDTLGTNLKSFEKIIGGIGNYRENQDPPEYNIV